MASKQTAKASKRTRDTSSSESKVATSGADSSAAGKERWVISVVSAYGDHEVHRFEGDKDDVIFMFLKNHMAINYSFYGWIETESPGVSPGTQLGPTAAVKNDWERFNVNDDAPETFLALPQNTAVLRALFAFLTTPGDGIQYGSPGKEWTTYTMERYQPEHEWTPAPARGSAPVGPYPNRAARAQANARRMKKRK